MVNVVEIQEIQNKDKLLVLIVAIFAICITAGVMYFSKIAQEKSAFTFSPYASESSVVRKVPKQCEICTNYIGKDKYVNNSAKICFDKVEELKKKALSYSIECFLNLLTIVIDPKRYMLCRSNYATERSYYYEKEKECTAYCDINGDGLFSIADASEFARLCY